MFTATKAQLREQLISALFITTQQFRKAVEVIGIDVTLACEGRVQFFGARVLLSLCFLEVDGVSVAVFSLCCTVGKRL